MEGLGYSPVVESLSSMCKALGLVPSTAKTNKRNEQKNGKHKRNHTYELNMSILH
jgi:hypothetical protein